jgi:hypothetical protein
MVRREEQPFTSRGTLLLDARSTAHRGQGPGSSLEWAVSGMASIGVALLRSGYTLRVMGDTGAELVPAPVPVVEGTLLEALACVQPSMRARLDGCTEQLRRTGVEGLLIAVLGNLDPDDAEQLARLRHGGGTCVAVLVDTPTWTGAPATSAHAAAATLLTRSGWRVLSIAHGTTLSSVWPQAATRSGRAHEISPGVPA